MAKRSIMGVISGKLGNMVGQKNSLVSNKDKQVWRVYQGTVANPKTIKQAHQRSLFVAAKNFQRAFEDILNHSWQGVEYGTKSLNHFRSMVLAGGGAGFPFFYQPRGAQTFIPQQWPISRGSLNINTKCSTDDGSNMQVVGIKTGIVPAKMTIGNFWKAFLEKNPQLQDGDMITVLSFIKNSNSDVLMPIYDRIIIDINDTTVHTGDIALQTQNHLFWISVLSDTEEIGPMDFSPVNGNTIIVAGGVIVSRQNGSKASWLRSKSNMYLNNEFYKGGTPYENSEYITACLDSFMTSTNAAESDWYLNQTGEVEPEQGGGGDTPSQTIALESKEAALTPSGSVNAAYLTKGSLRGYLMSNGQYFTLRDHDLTATSFDKDKSFSPSLTTIDLNAGLMEEIQAAGYHFYFPIEPDEP